MEPRDKKAADLQSLIQSLYRSAPEPAVDDLLKHSMRILNSFLGSSTPEEIQVTKQKVMEKVSRIYNNDSKTLVKVQELMQKISRSRTLSRKPQALKMLFKLSEMNPGVSESFDSLFKSKVLPTARQNTRLNTTETNFNSTVFSSARRPLPDQLLTIRSRGSPDQNISELEILREIAFIMQNISGNLIVTDKDFYTLKPNLNVSQPVRRIVRELCEIGWLFKKITGKIEDEGTVRDAFNIAVREELNEYYRWIALIENMAKSQELTLRKLVLWSFEPFERLKWIAIVSEAVNPYKGCKIISILNSYRPQGNPAINQLLNRLLSHIIQPLMKFIYLWIYKGQLNDPINQYFIYDDPTVLMPRLWQDKYTILWDNIPNLIDHESALMIFNIGKTINFLKKCCDHDYKIDVELIDVKVLFKQGDLSSSFPDEFKHWLRLISDRAHKELMDVLFNKFKLKMHLDAVKRFLLMGQGEFIHNLMDSLSKELDKPAHQIYKHNLEGIIDGALRSSNTRHLNEEISKRVSCRLLEQGSEGWDIFSLDYIIDSPLNALLSPDSMRSYLRIFNFLWKVKRVDHSLSQVWLSHAKQTVKARQDRSIFHSCHLLRYSMMHFVTNIYSYIMVAIESAWQGFLHNLDKAANFDEILAMHQKLLSQLLDITFLSPRTKNINTTLFNVFQWIYRFKISQNKLLEDYREYSQRLRDFNQRKKVASKNLISNDDLMLPVFETDAGRKIKDMKELYDKAFKQFSNLIKKEEEKLTFLNFRLDFSEYYEFLFVRKNYVE